MANTKVLIVENNNGAAEYLKHQLEALEYTVIDIIPSGVEAIQKAVETRPNLALIDMMLKGEMDGIEVAEQMRARFDIPVVYLTTHADRELLQRAKITGPFGYMLKPVEERRLQLNIEIALYMHEMERKFKEEQQWLSTILKSIGDAVIATDENGFVQFMNPIAEALTGWNQDEAFSQDLAEVFNVIGERTGTPIKQHIMKALRERIIVGQTEHNVLTAKSGKETPIDYSAAPIRDEKENITGVVLVFRDITERKQVEEKLKQTASALRNQTRILQSVLDSIADGVVVADENGELLLFNPAAEKIMGIDSTGTTLEEWANPNGWGDDLTQKCGVYAADTVTPFPIDDLPLVRALHGEASEEVEMFVRNPKVPDGTYITATGSPLGDESGVTKGGVVVYRDVTERKQADEALARAYTQGRLEIVDTLLHNIGNAINSVTIGIGTIHENLVDNQLTNRLVALADVIEEHQDGFGDYVTNNPQGQQVAPFVIALAKDFAKQNDKLAKGIVRVRDRAEHIADIVRMQKSLGRSSVYRKDINLKKTITDAIRVLLDSINKRNIDIQIDCEHAPKEIRTQESQFHQMLVNLVKNSIEAIDELATSGTPVESSIIRIRCYVRSGSFIVEVIDNGIGIEKDKFEVIFRGDYTTKESGSGLGLHSITNFINGLGGKIYPLSDGIGKGATMRVMLPLSSVIS